MKKHIHPPLLWRRIVIIVLLILQLLLIVYTLLSRSMVSTAVSSGLGLFSIFVCLYIISRRDKDAYKLTWVFLIMLFPLFGGVFYLLCRIRPFYGRLPGAIARTDEKMKAAYAIGGSTCDDFCIHFPHHATKAKYLENATGFPLYDNTQTKYLTPGEEKFRCLVEELQKAEKYIFLEYFIIREGIMWDTILDILKEKAAQGVKVRLIYDDFGCFFLLSRDYPAELKKYGIECVAFNPLRPVLSAVQNNRDHRKIAVIDGKVAFTGGINIADEYINTYEKHGHWKDASIMVTGRAAWSFTLMFLKMWELCTGTDEDYLTYYPWIDIPCPTAKNGFVQPYADSPMDSENTGEQVYLSIISGAKDYIYINTPYLIIDNGMMAALCHAAKSGVDVRIVTPHKWDKWMVHMTTRSYYRELIQAGVKIYEYTKGFIHSKTFVSDDSIATVGTVNLDYRSLYLHFECGAVLYGSSAVTEVKEDFLSTLSICQPISEEDCKCSFFMKIFQDVMRLFAPLL